jgi:hypothetical protein
VAGYDPKASRPRKPEGDDVVELQRPAQMDALIEHTSEIPIVKIPGSHDAADAGQVVPFDAAHEPPAVDASRDATGVGSDAVRSEPPPIPQRTPAAASPEPKPTIPETTSTVPPLPGPNRVVRRLLLGGTAVAGTAGVVVVIRLLRRRRAD